MATDKLEAAIEYAQRGWSVVPIAPGFKHPLVPWEEYQTRRASEDEIVGWWREYKNAEVGIVTGAISNLLVLDVDVHRGGDPQPIYSDHPTELISMTGKGGFHLFYRHPGGHVYNSVGENGVDIRADGGLVVVPPSYHPNGRQYEWRRYGEPGNAFFPRLPAAPPPDLMRQGERWFETTWQGVESGNRNDACARLAGYFSGRGLAFGVVLAMMQDWNNRNHPPMSSAEVERTVRSVFKTETRTDSRKRFQPTPAPPKTFGLMTMKQYMVKYGSQPVTWTIDEWLPDQTFLFVVSPPGSYKTWMMMDLAISVASGQPFLGQYPVVSPGPVIVIQQEDAHTQTAERLGLIAVDRFGLNIPDDPSDTTITVPPEIPLYFHPDRELRFDDPEIVAALREQVKAIKPKLVIVDPLYSTVDAESYMMRAAGQMMALKKMRDEFGCSFAMVHHTKKGAATELSGQRESAWGAQFLNAFLESGWQIRATETEASVSVHRHYKARGVLPDLSLSFDISTDPPYTYKVTVGDVEEAVAGQGGLSADIMAALVEKPMSVIELTKALKADRRKTLKMLQVLEEDGMVAMGGDNKYRVYTVGPE